MFVTPIFTFDRLTSLKSLLYRQYRELFRQISEQNKLSTVIDNDK